MRIWQIELPDSSPRARREAARLALRGVLAEQLGRAGEELRFAEGPHGKPRLVAPAAGSRLHFNLSHSGSLAVVAVSTAAPIGVDVEEVRDLPELERLVRFTCSAAERDAILALPEPERLRSFFRCWVRKEACLKAVGTGLARGPRSVEVSAEERPAVVSAPGPGELDLHDLRLPAGFAGAVASRVVA